MLCLFSTDWRFFGKSDEVSLVMLLFVAVTDAAVTPVVTGLETAPAIEIFGRGKI